LNRVQGVLAACGRWAHRETALLVVILLIATLFRTVLFEAAPPGLQHDEIFKANFALDVLDGGWPPYFDANGGEEALFPYLAAVSISLFGQNYFALRFVSLLCAILSIALSYRLVRELFGSRVAVLVVAALAVSFWHVFDSRVALRPITLLVMAVASFYLYFRAMRTGRIIWFALAGMCLGLSFHTYTSGFLIPVTILLYLVFYQLPLERDLLRRRWRGVLLALALAVIVALPMMYHVYTHPVASTARARDLSDHLNLFLAGEPRPLLTDVCNVLSMFGLRGDPEWRYNLEGRPIFDPLTFALFCGGVVICLRRIRRPEYAFLLIWLCVNVAPSAITRNSPSTLRAAGALTAIYILPALTLDLGFDWVGRRFSSRGTLALAGAVALLLTGNAVGTYRDYFGVWAQNAEVRDIYRADLSAVARYLEQSVTDEVVCISAEFAADLDQQTVYYMMGKKRSIRWFDGGQSLVLPEPSVSGETVYVFPATGPLREELASRFFSDLPVADMALDPWGEPSFVAYRLSPEELSERRAIEPAYPLGVSLGDRVELLGYELPPSVQVGDEIPLLLYWRVAQPIRPDLLYSFFAHLLDTRGYQWDQVDALGYPVSSWIEGDRVVQVFDLTVPPDAPPLSYKVKLGMYDLVTAERLTPRAEGAPLPGGAVSTESFSVTKAAVPPDVDTLDIPRERYADFDGKLYLLGCDLETLAAHRGEKVQISLYWQALVAPERDYMVSILITDEAGEVVLDEILREPVDGLYPTSLWSEGEIVRDRFGVIVDESIPEGRHRLWVRVWDPSTRSYLRLADSDEDRVRLGKVYVSPGTGG
jgi:4-amino-4-deoxy-L-arabinose transferase-like glycosyltransferase